MERSGRSTAKSWGSGIRCKSRAVRPAAGQADHLLFIILSKNNKNILTNKIISDKIPSETERRRWR